MSASNVGLLILCLWATSFSGPLCILSGRYFMKTGRNVTGHMRGQRSWATPYGPRIPARLHPKSDFTVSVQTGPAVRRHGRNILIFGILNLIGFVVLSFYFWTYVTDLSAQGCVVLGMLVALPLAFYFGTTR